MNDRDLYKNYILGEFIKDISEDEKLKQAIICQCRQMNRADVYEWIADDEIKIKSLVEENQQLKLYETYFSVIDKAKKFVKEFQESFDCYDDVYKDMNILLSILNKRGGTDE